MHTDTLVKALRGIVRWSKKGACFRKHTFTLTGAALGVTVVSTLHTSSGCTKGWTGHITHFVLPTVFPKIVFCSTKIQNSVLFSSESSKRECIHPYIPKVSQQVRLETSILMPYRLFFFISSLELWHWTTRRRQVPKAYPPILPLTWQSYPKTWRPWKIYPPPREQNIQLQVTQKQEYIQVYIHTFLL